MKKNIKPKSDLPSKIKCVKCSKQCGVRPDVLEARIKLHGTLEKLLAEYFCRGCRKKNVYIINDKPVVKKTGSHKTITPLMQRCLDREMWWQQPGFVFPGSGEKYAAVGPEMTFAKNEKGELVMVPVKTQSALAGIEAAPVPEET